MFYKPNRVFVRYFKVSGRQRPCLSQLSTCSACPHAWNSVRTPWTTENPHKPLMSVIWDLKLGSQPWPLVLTSVFFGSSVSSAGLEALLSFLTSWNSHSGWELLLHPRSAADNGECHHSWSRMSVQSKHSRHHCWRRRQSTSHTAHISSSQASSVRSNEGGGDEGRQGKVIWPWVTPHKINNRVKGKKIRTHTRTHRAFLCLQIREIRTEKQTSSHDSK